MNEPPNTEPARPLVHRRSDAAPVTDCGLTIETTDRWDWQIPESGWVGPYREWDVTCPDCQAALAARRVSA